MKIAIAQTKPVKGDISANIIAHKKLVSLAVAQDANAIFFPELSITGYEPTLASKLAIDAFDSSLDEFQEISNTNKIIIAVGMPTVGNSGIHITMIIFQPHAKREIYHKQFLHEDELPWFVAGNQQFYINIDGHKIATAICYELSVPAHSENTFKNGADTYVACVAKTAAGMERSARQLSDIAKNYGMTVLIANSTGYSDNFLSAGQSAAWNNKGELLTRLDDVNEGIILLDTVTQQVIQTII